MELIGMQWVRGLTPDVDKLRTKFSVSADGAVVVVVFAEFRAQQYFITHQYFSASFASEPKDRGRPLPELQNEALGVVTAMLMMEA